MTSPRPLRPGDVIHALADGLTLREYADDGLRPARVLRRGDTIQVSDDLLAANMDRVGKSPLDLVDDVTAQVDLWGRRMFARGPAPDGLRIPAPGTPEHAEAREVARRAAWSMAGPQARAEALADVERLYGPAPATSRTMGVYTGDEQGQGW